MQCDVIWLHKRGTMKDQNRGKLIQDYQRRVNRVHYGRNKEILIKNGHAHICSKRLIKEKPLEESLARTVQTIKFPRSFGN